MMRGLLLESARQPVSFKSKKLIYKTDVSEKSFEP